MMSKFSGQTIYRADNISVVALSFTEPIEIFGYDSIGLVSSELQISIQFGDIKRRDDLSNCCIDFDSWLLPDPAEQFSNPYLAMGNNPVMYKDPNGEWVHIVIGAVIGGTINWMTHGAQWNAEGLGYFGVGALAGGLAAGIGAGVSSALVPASQGGSFAAGFAGSTAVSSTGFAAGAVTGAASGVTNGLITGVGNTFVDNPNANIGQALNKGFDNAWKQGLSGAAIGGLVGGIQASNQGKDFWTGAGEEHIVPEIKANGNVVDNYDQTDYLNGNKTEAFDHHSTILDNSNRRIDITQNPDGTFRTEIRLPNRITATGVDGNQAILPFDNQVIGNRIIFNSVRNPQGTRALLLGDKFRSRPINEFRDLFYSNSPTPWIDRGFFPWSW